MRITGIHALVERKGAQISQIMRERLGKLAEAAQENANTAKAAQENAANKWCEEFGALLGVSGDVAFVSWYLPADKSPTGIHWVACPLLIFRRR